MSSSAFGPGNTVLLEARERVANRFGTSFARKASSAVCLKFGGAAPFESQQDERLVLEMEAIPVREIEQARQESATGTTANRRASYGERFEYTGTPDKTLRLEIIHKLRESFVARTRTVQQELQRLDKQFQTCWLNQTILVVSKVAEIAEMAQDQSLNVIDLPRRLWIEEADDPPGLRLFRPRSKTECEYTGKNVIIALIDREVNMAHSGLSGRIEAKENYTEEKWGSPDWHATAVAGILGGRSSQFYGSAPECVIQNYKVFRTRGETINFQGVLALQDALANGADIANCSWGGNPVDLAASEIPREVRACDLAWDLGMTIVKSAGNKQVLTTPAEARGVIAVGACDVFGNCIPDYSGRGRIGDGTSRPHLVAPGGTKSVQMYSFGHNIYSKLDPIVGGLVGTSFAAPCVSGIAARLLEAHREAHPEAHRLKPDDLRQRLLALCQLIPGADLIAQGAGRLFPGATIT